MMNFNLHSMKQFFLRGATAFMRTPLPRPLGLCLTGTGHTASEVVDI